MPLGPPSFALSTRLVGFGSVADLLDTVKGWPMERLLGRMLPVEGGQVVLYPQDAAYNSGRLEAPGPRHRLWLVRAGWKYQRDL